MNNLILGIETSCDETAVALYHSKKGLLAHQLHSQVALHNQYGGVVPELASRDHIKRILPLLKATLAQGQCELTDVTGVAYTQGPGLVGALLVGASFAKSLGFALKIPTLGIHHLEAHLLAPMLEEQPPSFPFLALLVSGGHTLLVAVEQLGNYQLLGETLDDAAGEALDKTAKLLGLPYPGGPALETLAQQGNSKRFHFPRPMMDRPGLDFSFSGLKTVAVNAFRQEGSETQTKADLACAFQEAIIDTLALKTERALKQTQLKSLVLAGGVTANQHLRTRMQQMAKKLNVTVHYPRPSFCTDNAAMVAYTGYQRMLAGDVEQDLAIRVFPRWELSNSKNKNSDRS